MPPTGQKSIRESKPRPWLICLLLALITFGVFWPVTHDDFTNYDDDRYITANPHVRSGLSWAGTKWAFQSFDYSNWHPLTWLSHMFDYQLYGMTPTGHHLTNVVFHIANTLLLFLLLRQMTGARWRSAVVAALFAWHPLHVESVAWAAERKDVLSTFFWMLSLMAYVRYVERFKVRGPKHMVFYGLALLAFVLGLMSKPMVVTLPFVMLLLDFWPLNRLQLAATPSETKTVPSGRQGSDRRISATVQSWPASLGRLVLEKVPFLILAAISCRVTFVAQNAAGSVMSLEAMPMTGRLANVGVAYIRYLQKMFWPENLAVLYPYSGKWPLWLVVMAYVLLAGISAAVVIMFRRRGYFAFGWFWYLGTLVPVIGLVQVGWQSMADRYAYIPLIGVFIIIVWGGSELAVVWLRRKWIAGFAAVLVLAGCIAVTEHQLQYWKNSVALFRHTLDVTTDNYLACNNLGIALKTQGKFKEAMFYYDESLSINPDYTLARFNKGVLLTEEGKPDDAELEYKALLKIAPDDPQANNNLANILMERGKIDEGMEHYRTALKRNPAYVEARCNLAHALADRGNLAEAISQYELALQTKPELMEAHYKLAIALAKNNQPEKAIEQFLATIRLQPGHWVARCDLAALLAKEGKLDQALTQYNAALKLKPDSAEAHFGIANVLAKQGKAAAAGEQYREALRLKPEWPSALNGLAWLLATTADADARDGPAATQLAERACELTGHRNATFLATLAAAYAETGRNIEAVTTAEKALGLITSAAQEPQAVVIRHQLEKYRAGQPFYDSPGAP